MNLSLRNDSGKTRFEVNSMLKILLAFLMTIEILILLLMIYCLSGISIILPGMGLIISGGLIAVLLFFVELILLWATLILYRRLCRDSGRMA